MSSTEHLILIRIAAELAIKSRRTRSGFTRRLVGNIDDALQSAGIAHEVADEWGRIYVQAGSAAALPLLARVFGLSSLSPITRVVPSRLADIVAAGEEVFGELVEGKTFAVRAHRVGRHDFKSRDIAVQLGAALLPKSAGVDLSDPAATACVEVRDGTAYLFSQRMEGPGGLPLGVEGTAVSLISGGYDSAVSAWLMLKRGIALDYVFCNLGGEAYERAVLQVAKVLADDWSYGTRPRLHVVDFDAPLRELRQKVRPAYWQVVLKRMMYRAASRIARLDGAAAIITGEAVGQVSSQTLANLCAIEPAAELPVLRPLLGFDKEEIIARARHIGTAALSEQVKEYCAIAPGHPATAATVERVDAQERLMDASPLEAAIAERRTLDLRGLSSTDLVAPYLFVTEIPADAVVFDCRPAAQYQAWHLKGAVQRDEWDLLRDFRRLNKDRTYVLYCAHGIQTAYLAEKMQRAGFEAYSFRGGVRGVMRYAQRKGLNLNLLR